MKKLTDFCVFLTRNPGYLVLLGCVTFWATFGLLTGVR
jgi:hypothetical protein